MTAGQLYRLSGGSLVAGAVLSIISSVLAGVLFPDTGNPSTAGNPLNFTLALIGVVGTVLAIFGLPGLYLRRAKEGGVLWLLGVLLIAVTGMLFGIFASLTFAIVFPPLAAQAPALFEEGPPPAFLGVFIIGTLANVFGAAFMAVPMLTRQIYPRWCGWLMALEAVLAAVSFVANGPSSSGVLSQVLNLVSPLPLFIVLGWIGYELWTSQPASSEALHEAVTTQTA
jgi:hypothetical protein